MKNGDRPAFANPGSDQGPGSSGLTKREYFAAMAMQGLVGSWMVGNCDHSQRLAEDSVKCADALLLELEKK